MFSRSTALVFAIALFTGCTNSVEYGLTNNYDVPGSRGVAIDQQDEQVYTGLGSQVCEAQIDQDGLYMIDSDSGVEENEVLDADGGLVLTTDGMTVVVMNPDNYETTEVPVDGTPMDGQLHDDDVVIVNDQCELSYILQDITIHLPSHACDGRLVSGDRLYWHASNGTVFDIAKDGTVTDLGVADSVSWHEGLGIWMLAEGNMVRAMKDDVIWTTLHTAAVLDVFPFADRIGLRDDSGTIFSLDADGANSERHKWVGAGGTVVGSTDGITLFMDRGGLVAIPLAD